MLFRSEPRHVRHHVSHGVGQVEHHGRRNLLARLAQQRLEPRLVVGNLDARRDWGFAGDYVQGMWQMLQLDRPEDFVISMGVTHSVREFTELAFGVVGLQLGRSERLGKIRACRCM